MGRVPVTEVPGPAAREQVHIAHDYLDRHSWLAKTMTAKRFATAISDLASVPADRYPVLPFMPRAYELRSNVSPYDATYVALAEQLACVLITADARLARAHGPRCSITVL